jgi:hypothetical protein
LYFWHPGYWGRHVGFYGGINYGCGYTGFGYQGGYWDRGSFWYNRSVNNVNITNITNTYNTTVVNNAAVTRVSYNGGSGGVIAQPTPQDRTAARETHTPMLPVQVRHELAASSNRAQFASVNNGRPAIVATPRPERFASEPAASRGFSQHAAVQPGALRSGHLINPNSRVNNDQRQERRVAPVNQGAASSQLSGRQQTQMRPQSPRQVQMRPQSSPQAPMRPQGPPQVQMRPQSLPQATLRPQGPPQAQMRPQSLPQGQVRRQGPPQGPPRQTHQQPQPREQRGGPYERAG